MSEQVTLTLDFVKVDLRKRLNRLRGTSVLVTVFEQIDSMTPENFKQVSEELIVNLGKLPQPTAALSYDLEQAIEYIKELSGSIEAPTENEEEEDEEEDSSLSDAAINDIKVVGAIDMTNELSASSLGLLHVVTQEDLDINTKEINDILSVGSNIYIDSKLLKGLVVDGEFASSEQNVTELSVGEVLIFDIDVEFKKATLETNENE